MAKTQDEIRADYNEWIMKLPDDGAGLSYVDVVYPTIVDFEAINEAMAKELGVPSWKQQIDNNMDQNEVREMVKTKLLAAKSPFYGRDNE